LFLKDTICQICLLLGVGALEMVASLIFLHKGNARTFCIIKFVDTMSFIWSVEVEYSCASVNFGFNFSSQGDGFETLQEPKWGTSHGSCRS
jgi:hypothetical protein